jgi:hypothetical protein
MEHGRKEEQDNNLSFRQRLIRRARKILHLTGIEPVVDSGVEAEAIRLRQEIELLTEQLIVLQEIANGAKESFNESEQFVQLDDPAYHSVELWYETYQDEIWYYLEHYRRSSYYANHELTDLHTLGWSLLKPLGYIQFQTTKE